ncbi:hypothetical protein [Thermophilibacter sp.]
MTGDWGTVIGGASALRYWRMPPLMSAIVRCDVRAVPADRLRLSGVSRELRKAPICLELLGPDRDAGRPVSSPDLVQLRRAAYEIAPCLELPVDVAVTGPARRRASRFLRPTVMDPELLEGRVVAVREGLSVTSPALTLLMLAGCLDEARLLMVATELCGTFAVYRAQPCVARLLEELHAGGVTPSAGGWRPSFAADGSLTDLWSRPALTTPRELAELAVSAAGRRGCRRLGRVAGLVVPGAASPLEARTGILLGLGAENGGMGLGGFSFNARVVLDARGRSLSGQSVCYCDLLWSSDGPRRALDVECHSADFHEGEGRALSDANRALALQSMGIEVMHVTHAQLASEHRFDALASMVAERLGIGLPEPTPEFLARRHELRRTVLSDWGSVAYR